MSGAAPLHVVAGVIRDSIMLPDLEIGELVVGRVMGAYTWASASTFNFFPKASILILDSAQKQKLVAVA